MIDDLSIDWSIWVSIHRFIIGSFWSLTLAAARRGHYSDDRKMSQLSNDAAMHQ
jgi:hypothetical protein